MKIFILIISALVGLTISGPKQNSAQQVTPEVAPISEQNDPRAKALAVSDAYKKKRATGKRVSGSTVEEIAKELGFKLSPEEAKFLGIYNSDSLVNSFLTFCPNGDGVWTP